MTNKSKKIILAWPATKYRDRNPYGWLLYRAIQDNGNFNIIEYSAKNVLFSHYNILHVHWPEKQLSEKSLLIAFLKTLKVLALLAVANIKRRKIVWTVHNSVPHTIYHPKLTKAFYNIFTGMISGFICLSPYSFRQAIETHPSLKSLPHFAHPFGHGHYRDIYPNIITKDQAKKDLGLIDDTFTLLFFGNISPYKNVVQLANIFSHVDRTALTLLIAGDPNTTELRSEIENIAGNDPRIHLRFGFIPVDEVQHFFKASDLVVLPFSNMQNSGTALLALSFNVPILVPETGSMIDLQELIGKRHVITYDNNLTEKVLEKAIEFVLDNHSAPSNINLDSINWEAIAKETEEFYNVLINIS